MRNKVNKNIKIIIFCSFLFVLMFSEIGCEYSENNYIIELPYTIQMFGTNIDLCELHKMYQKSNDSLYIQGKYIPVRNYNKIFNDDFYKDKSCLKITKLLLRKYKLLEKSLIIQKSKSSINIIGLGLLFDYSTHEYLEISFCFDKKEYQKFDKLEIPNKDSIVNLNSITNINNLLDKVKEFKIIQCLLYK